MMWTYIAGDVFSLFESVPPLDECLSLDLLVGYHVLFSTKMCGLD